MESVYVKTRIQSRNHRPRKKKDQGCNNMRLYMIRPYTLVPPAHNPLPKEMHRYISGPPAPYSQRMMFVNTTAIAYVQKIGRSLTILVVCNSSCVHKGHAFASSSWEASEGSAGYL